MTKQHWGAIGAVVFGYAFSRILDYWLVDVVGDVGRHHRASDLAVGVVVAAVPFALLVLFTAMHLLRPALLHQRAVKVLLLVGWVFAGGVMGLLPYSRMGTATNLLHKESRTAPGFLHGLDITILVGVVVTVALLLVALRARRDHTSRPSDWIEHQFEDER